MRLSLDARVQPLSAPRSWQTETSLEELRGFRADCQALLEERGVVGKEFERMITGGWSNGHHAATLSSDRCCQQT